MDAIENDVRATLLYFDLWKYPLTAEELYAFLPHNSISYTEFKKRLETLCPNSGVVECRGFYFLKERTAEVVARRNELEKRAGKMWRMARISTFLIKRFPFVRGVMVSGELSKNLATEKGDVDFFIIAAPNRLWIARALLILFKKIFLLNRKKYFCLNTFITSDRLALEEKNIYVAAEIAYLKSTYNLRIFREFLQANSWVRDFFPNFDRKLLPSPELRVSERRSVIQRILEFPFALIPSDRLDTFLLRTMRRVWQQRYPDPDEVAHAHAFRSTKTESRSYPLDFQDLVLREYARRIKAFVSPPEMNAGPAPELLIGGSNG